MKDDAVNKQYSLAFDSAEEAQVDTGDTPGPSSATAKRSRPDKAGVVFVSYGGRRWYVLKGGYYRNREGRLLHRRIYEDTFGPIPEGYDIHHVDHNPGNNSPMNLIAVTRAVHLRLHSPKGWLKFGHEMRSRMTIKGWQGKQSTKRICESCGTEYESTGQRSKFCHPTCRQSLYRAQDPERYRATVRRSLAKRRGKRS